LVLELGEARAGFEVSIELAANNEAVTVLE
jgi:hypothetical protein